MTDFWFLAVGDKIELLNAPKQNPQNKFKNGTKGKVWCFYDNGISLTKEDGNTIRLYEPFVFNILEKVDTDEERIINVSLTEKQFDMISNCVEHISAYEREFDDEDEQTLKEVAGIFRAEYNNYNEDEDEDGDEG